MQSLINDYISDNPGGDDTIEIKQAINRGARVRDDIANSLFSLRINRKDAKELGACIEGYPKTEAQIQFMRNTLKIEPTFIFILECSDNYSFERYRVFDSITANHYSIQEVKNSGDVPLLGRIQQLANERKPVLSKRIEGWDITRRGLLKYYESKTMNINIEKYTESQVFEKITFILRTMRN